MRRFCWASASFLVLSLTACTGQKDDLFTGVSIKASPSELEKDGFACLSKDSKITCSRFERNGTYLGHQIQGIRVTFREDKKTPLVINADLPSELVAGYPIGQTGVLSGKLDALYTPGPDKEHLDKYSLMRWWTDKKGGKVRLMVSPNLPPVIPPTVTVGYFPAG
ncbi:UNVERIFIED_CONTAM: hypothetical protein C7454_12547 [Acidovorax defluvii]